MTTLRPPYVTDAKWIEPREPETLYFTVRGMRLCIYTRQYVDLLSKKTLSSGLVYWSPGTFVKSHTKVKFGTLIYKHSPDDFIIRCSRDSKEVHVSTGWTEATAVTAAVRFMTEGLLPIRPVRYYVTSHS